MNSKMIKKFCYCFIVTTLILNVTACGKWNSAQKQSEELLENSEIHFSDFLVERCVRKTLNKSWDDKITRDEAASVKSLLIDPIFDPSIDINSLGLPTFAFYRGYIDLVDLQYLTGLETLKIDNFVDYDMVVNVDSISNCKKLKKLYMQWSPHYHSLYTGAGYGYKYWADIIGALPELEYVDLGIYIDSHMKEIMLSKSSNKQIVFYNGYNDRYATQVLSYPSARYSNPMIITNVQQYGNTMKYEYNGSDIDLDNKGQAMLGKIPMLSVKSNDELQQALNTLSESTEDLCISLWKDCLEFDCSLLSKFKNLNTLTIVKDGSIFTYSTGRAELVELKNTDCITQLPYLQVINLAACTGDISYLKNVKRLRELTLLECDVKGINALGDLKELTELKIKYTDCDNINKNLNEVKYYECLNAKEDDPNCESVKYMPKLQSVWFDNGLVDLSVLNNCTNLENLNILELKSYKKYDIKNIASLSKLKTVRIRGGQIINAEEIINIPNIVSIVMENYTEYMDSESVSQVVQKALKHDKISLISLRADDMSMFDKNNSKILYEKGIHDGLVQVEIMDRLENKEKTFEEAWKEIEKERKNVNTPEDTTANSSYGYESYVGTYYSENSTPETIYTKGGSCIEIQSVSGNNVKFTITAISSAPSNRVATVKAEGSIGENGIVNFSYSDDGWGNSGTGAIVLKNDKIVVTSSMKKADSSAMWKLPDYHNSLFVRK